MSIDWSEAPKGATHWDREICCFCDAGGAWGSLGGAYFRCTHNEWDTARYIKREIDQWNGKGLPPVGTVCEGRVKNGGHWIKCKILALTDRFIIASEGQSDEFSMSHVHWEFRPIRTAEQIAADEREAHVLGMLCHDALGNSRRGLAEALYDAGYRKQVKP